MSNGHRATVRVELLIGNGEAVELGGQFTKQPSACALNASCTSHTSICSGVSPARLIASLDRMGNIHGGAQ